MTTIDDTTPTTSSSSTVTAPPASEATPRPTAMPSTARVVNSGRPERGPVSRFFRSVFSHLLFAGVVVGGVLGYLYQGPIMRDVGNTVCSNDMLGQFMSTPPATAVASKAAPSVAQTSATTSTGATTTVQETSSPSKSNTADKPAVGAPPVTAPPTAADSAAHSAPHTTIAATEAPSRAPSSSTPAPASKPTAEQAPQPAAVPGARDVALSAAPPIAQAPQPAKPQEPVGAPVERLAAAPSPTQPAPTTTAPATTAPAATAPATTAPTATAAAPNTQATATAPASTATAALATDTKKAEPATPATKDESKSTSGGIPTSSDDRATMFKDWAAAREAFAKGKPEAVTIYLDLAKRFPEVPELTGELGNIYFQQGNTGEAAAQYYETAQRLLRNGQAGPAACLIDVMRYLDANKAKTLQEQIKVPCPVLRQSAN